MVSLSDIAKTLNLDPKQSKQDISIYGKVTAINADKTYQVSLNGSDVTVKCARLTGAKVGDIVLVTILKNGYAVVTGCVGGDKDALETAQHFWVKDGSDSEAGAHVTEVPREDFESTPTGGNLLLRSNAVKIRNAAVVLSELNGSGMIVYSNGTKMIEMAGSLTSYYDTAGHKITDIYTYTDSLHYKGYKIENDDLEALPNYARVLIENSDGTETAVGTPVTGRIKLSAGGHYIGAYQGGVMLELTPLSSINMRISENTTTNRLTLTPAGLTTDKIFTAGALDNGVFDVTTEDIMASTTINGHDHIYGTTTINDASRAKYYPLGIVGWNSPNSSALIPDRLRLSDRNVGSAEVSYDIRNVHDSTAATGKITADILWLKVTA